ncbi:MAG TPA: hypothetical protein VN721_10285 [Flavipsychrobacter sp.]|nr:hypothetical protein [Flavipsychrobacter sp.]
MKSQLKITAKLLFIVYLMLFNQEKALSQPEAALDSDLKEISRQMVAEDNPNFILVDAVIDGLIKPGRTYTIEYNPQEIKINGNELAKPLKKQYITRLKEFYALWGNDTIPNITKTGSIRLEDIFDSASTIRRENGWVHFTDSSEKARIKFFGDLLKQAAHDHLADTAGPVHIVYKEGNVFVNDRKVKKHLVGTYNEIAKKYAHYKPSKTDKGELTYFKH